MLDCKGLTYSISKDSLMIKDRNITIIINQLDTHNLYRINIGNNILVTIPLAYAMITTTSQLPTDLTIWHCRFAYLNCKYLKRLPNMISSMKIPARAKDLSIYIICV